MVIEPLRHGKHYTEHFEQNSKKELMPEKRNGNCPL